MNLMSEFPVFIPKMGMRARRVFFSFVYVNLPIMAKMSAPSKPASHYRFADGDLANKSSISLFSSEEEEKEEQVEDAESSDEDADQLPPRDPPKASQNNDNANLSVSGGGKKVPKPWVALKEREINDDVKADVPITDILKGLSLSEIASSSVKSQDKVVSKISQSIRPASERSESFFRRLHNAKQLQPRILTSSSSSSSSSKSTLAASNNSYGPPVRSFKSDTGSFMEPMTPKSSQWGRRIDVNAIRNPVALNSPKKFISEPNKFALSKGKRAWGRADGLDSGGNFGSSSASDLNSFQYIAPVNATDAVKNLLDSFEGEDDNKAASDEVEGLEVKLLKHQVGGLKFLRSREGSKIESKGGLLCDDMGLGKTIQSIALILSNKYISSSEGASQTKSTLVVAPLALTSQWAQEINSKAPSLRVYVHHGQKRAKTSKDFHTYDVIITTYQVVTMEHQGKGPLYDLIWWRIILDEAHTIKNRNAKSSLAACALMADSRWCLTGTPIQNNADELYSLLKFLGISPYNDYSTWMDQISRPISSGQAKIAMQRLHVILKVIMLRRTKSILIANGINLPGRHVHRQFLDFDDDERKFYNKLEAKVGNNIKNMLAGSGGGRQMLNVLLLLLRLRQVCDHVDLSHGKIDEDDKESVTSSYERNQKSNEDDDLSSMLTNLSLTNENNKELDKLGLEERDPSIDKPVSSTKIRELLKILSIETDRKTIVFSQFTCFLNLIEPFLKNHKIGFARYDGSMKVTERDKALDLLRSDPNVKVLLCSLKCGALGLNLTCANRVVLLDPWWNPMISEQAIDRVHRIGQTVDVDVYELIIRNSVEERILKLQDKKRELAKGIIENGITKKGFSNGITAQEIMSLFR